jgi:hypothetical protein
MKHMNTQRRLGGVGLYASRTPTLSEDNFGLQRALALRELKDRQEWAKRERRRERMEAVLGPVKGVEAAMMEKAAAVYSRGKERAGGMWHGMLIRVQHGVREVMERRA